jgi:ABC-type amino acid transport substrate-binding protein
MIHFRKKLAWSFSRWRATIAALIVLVLIAAVATQITRVATRAPAAAPVIIAEQDTFIGEPVILNWEYERAVIYSLVNLWPQAPIVFEVESARDPYFVVDLARYPLAEGHNRIFRHVNASRFWRVRAISKQTYQPISDWSQPAKITQFDSAYRRITATNQVLVFVSHSDYEDMFKWVDRNAEGFAPQGFEINFSKLIVHRLADSLTTWLEPRFTAVSWPELLNMPWQGRADIIIGSITKRRQRERDFRLSFSDTYFCTVQSLVYRLGEPAQPIRDMIRGKRIGYQRNTTSEPLVLELAKELWIEQKPFDRPEVLIQSILDGTVDYGVTDSPFSAVQEFAEHLTGASPLDHQEFKKSDFPASIPEDQRVEEYAIGMRAGDPDLLHEINGIMAGMKQDGTLLRLLIQANRDYQLARGLHPDTSEADVGEKPWECSR